MEFRENVDSLMSGVRMKEGMRRTIMEAAPQSGREKSLDRKGQAGAGRRPKNGRTVWRQAAVPAAAALLVMSTMYVGAGYLIEHTPLRDIFVSRDETALPVPEVQQRPDIYDEILDSSYTSADTGTEAADGGAGTVAEGDNAKAAPQGTFGEKIIDNDQFSIELLETTCSGRELTISYILTRKTDEIITVNVCVDNDYLGQWRDGAAGEEYDSERSLLRGGFGDSFAWNKLPADCGFGLAENQELCILTQLGKKDYESGTYTLYADSFVSKIEAPPVTEGESWIEEIEEEPEISYYRADVEIVGNERYGFALSGTTDKTEGKVHFTEYDIYVSPMTVYLTLEGTYEGEITSIWGAESSHDITIGFRDGTETHTTVLLSGMGYGFGDIDVDMRASFDTAIDPEAITRIVLDGVVLMGE